MTRDEKKRYADANELRQIFEALRGRKFKLDCGHHVTFGHFLANDITIINASEIHVICRECGY